jgi:signal transduction histidine kinase
MASGIAHDIRNPLNFVSLAVDQLHHKWGTDGVLDGQTQELLQGMRTELRRVNQIVQDFLDYGRPYTVLLESVPSAEILHRSVDVLLRRHSADRLSLQIDSAAEGSLIRADRSLLERTLVNLLENALDASGPEGAATAGIHSDPQDKERLVFWVQDSGQGIPVHQLDKIFTPYFTTKPSGVGLGLALAQKWTREMAGDLRVNNVAGGGARFELSFPIVK